MGLWGRTGHQEEFAEGVGWGGWGRSHFGPGPTVHGQAETLTGWLSGITQSHIGPGHPALSDSGNLGWLLS